jgi:hypothetical protein
LGRYGRYTGYEADGCEGVKVVCEAEAEPAFFLLENDIMGMV